VTFLTQVNTMNRIKKADTTVGLVDPALRKILVTAASSAVLSGTGLLATPSVFAQANRASGRSAKSITVGFRANPSSLDPHTGSGGSDHTILFTMFDTLIVADNNFRPQPGLAQSWELRGDRELLLKIRRGVKFHDGTTLDAAAVKWNIERIKDPKTRSTAAGSVSAIESVQVLDSYSVLIRTSAPSSPLLLNLADRAGMMISPASVAKYGEDVRRNPVGTGPYRFDSWRQDSNVRVVAHEGYWDPKNMARTGTINYRVFANEGPMIAALQTGEVDIGLLADTSVPILRTSPKVSLIVRPGSRVLGLRGNTSIGPLGDRNVRLAMAHTFDRDQIFNTLFKDGGSRGDGIISPAHAWAYDPKFKGPVRDLNKARALLKQSSMPDGFELKIAAPTSVPEAVAVAQILQVQLKEIGVTVSINNMELSRMVPAIKAGTMHAQSSFFSIRPDPDGYIFDQYHSTGGFYYGKDPQPLIDKLLTRARQSFDMAERRSLYLQAQEAVINLEATGFVWGCSSATWAVNNRIKGFSAGPEGKGRFHLIEVA
jgi:peptide/nickel transport system substrate-binding protein